VRNKAHIYFLPLTLTTALASEFGSSFLEAQNIHGSPELPTTPGTEEVVENRLNTCPRFPAYRMVYPGVFMKVCDSSGHMRAFSVSSKWLLDPYKNMRTLQVISEVNNIRSYTVTSFGMIKNLT
jgi:hypothetical protein